MVNTLQIKRDESGTPVALHFKGRTNQNYHLDNSIALFLIKIGDLVNGATIFSFVFGEDDQTYPVTLDTHLHDPEGMPGKIAYDILADLTMHTLHPHSRDVTPTRTLAEEGINNLGLSIANIFGRLKKLEASFDVVYTSFVVRGRELQCFTGERGKSICSVNLSTNFIGCQTPLNPDNLEDSRQILTIQTALGKITIHVANTGELGKINDAVQANSEIPVNSTPLPA